MSRYQPYPSYKDSGVEWLREVPEHWETQRIKFLFHIGRGRVISQEELIDEGTYPVYSSQTKNNGCLGYIETYDFDCQQITWTTDGANAGTVFLREGKHNCTNVCGTLQAKNNDCNINFIASALQYATQFYKRPDTNGAKIMNGEMAEIFVTLPPVSEQTTIANFLDRETAKIDTMIAKQERMIELLDEKRSALISHAVTKGLDPKVTMKYSGVEWLGEVPGHWIRSNIGFETIVKARLGWKGLKAEEYVEDGYIFLATPNIKNSEIDFENVNYITQERYEESPEIILEEGDVLVTKDGSTTGTTNVVRELPRPATVNSSIAVIRPKGNIDSLYLYYFFVSTYIQETINLMRGGMGVPHLFQGDLRKFDMLVPPKVEQKQIADYLDAQTAKIDTLIAKARQAIELMKERRTALISAAVTGKIDVRGMA